MTDKTSWIIIITGPTASGKTALSERVLHAVNGEIINVDVGQFYKPLSVGTAKPNWEHLPYTCHMFDVLDRPVDLSVAEYRSQVLTLFKEISQKGKVPILVGGSLFYIKSLFFPPKKSSGQTTIQTRDFSETNEELWSELNRIDPSRAADIHPHDRYRLTRALAIWKSTGEKPSTYKPDFKAPDYNVLILPLLPERHTINQRINQRTGEMIYKDGWPEEAQRMYGTEWQPFIEQKGLIGYPELFEWIKNGSKPDLLASVVETIQKKTRDYAKRQMTFWRGFEKRLSQQSSNAPHNVIVHHAQDISLDSFKKIAQTVKEIVK